MVSITADQVANAYAFNLGGLGNGLQSVQEQLQRKAALDRQRQKDIQAQQLQALSFAEDATKGLDGGTGSPLDDYLTQQVASARQGIVNFARTNSDPIAQYAYAQNAVKGIRQQHDNAKRLVANVGMAVKQAQKDDPYLDDALVQNAYLNKAFYTTDESGNRVLVNSVNPNVNFTGDLVTNPISRAQFLNRTAIERDTPDQLGKLYPAIDQNVRTVQNGLPVVMKAKIPAYATIDPETGNTRINFESLSIPGAKEKITAAPKSIVDNMAANPVLSGQLLFSAQEAKKQYPKADNDQLMQIAAANVLQRHGVGKGDAQAEVKVDETYKQRQAESRDAFNRTMRLRADARGQQNLAMRVAAKAQKAQEQLTDPLTIFGQQLTGTLNTNPQGMEYAKMHTIEFGGVPALDVTSMAQKDHLISPYGKYQGKPVRVYSFTDPNSLQTSIRVIPLAKDKAGGYGFNATDPLGQVLTGKELRKYYTAIGSQLQLAGKAKKENFKETVESADDFPEE